MLSDCVAGLCRGGKHNCINRLSANSPECVCLVQREPLVAPRTYINDGALSDWGGDTFATVPRSHLVEVLGVSGERVPVESKYLPPVF